MKVSKNVYGKPHQCKLCGTLDVDKFKYGNKTKCKFCKNKETSEKRFLAIGRKNKSKYS